jgi:adenylosuccinate synthase
MPVSIVAGGQYGSEGKGKVAQFVAAEQDAAAAVRVGGPNSGHTTLAPDDQKQIFRHLPTAAMLPDVVCILPAGSYVRAEILLEEVARAGLGPERLVIDRRATLVTDQDVDAEGAGTLGARIGSTCSGTGEAVAKRVRRRVIDDLVVAQRELRPYLGDATAVLRSILSQGKRVVLEGTQGFGLSLLHSPHFPMVTSRDTSAAAILSETGLSPLDVDDVVLVLRALPIRVAGNSGPFDAEELDWERVRAESVASAALLASIPRSCARRSP